MTFTPLKHVAPGELIRAQTLNEFMDALVSLQEQLDALGGGSVGPPGGPIEPPGGPIEPPAGPVDPAGRVTLVLVEPAPTPVAGDTVDFRFRLSATATVQAKLSALAWLAPVASAPAPRPTTGFLATILLDADKGPLEDDRVTVVRGEDLTVLVRVPLPPDGAPGFLTVALDAQAAGLTASAYAGPLRVTAPQLVPDFKVTAKPPGVIMSSGETVEGGVDIQFFVVGDYTFRLNPGSLTHDWIAELIDGLFDAIGQYAVLSIGSHEVAGGATVTRELRFRARPVSPAAMTGWLDIAGQRTPTSQPVGVSFQLIAT